MTSKNCQTKKGGKTHVNIFTLLSLKIQSSFTSRSTDAKTSETPVVDDVPQPPPNSSPGEPQQQRVHKRVNKKVNKKVKREI